MAKYVRTEEGYKDYNEIRSTPDWSDNNELSPNYIKNRTHYDLRELLWLVGNEDTLETITLDRTFYEYHNSSRGVSLHIIDNVNINRINDIPFQGTGLCSVAAQPFLLRGDDLTCGVENDIINRYC